MIRIFSVGIRSIPHLEVFLDSTVGFGLAAERRQPVDAVAGWGLRNSANKAIRYARRMNLPYLALEDGFLRSLGLGHHEPPLSIVVDDLGMYYDANRPSRLESLIMQTLTPNRFERTRQLIDKWREGRVSKYNHLREHTSDVHFFQYDETSSGHRHRPLHGQEACPYVLVVDQTKGDVSIRYGQAGPDSFRFMLEAALAEHPDCSVLVKIHPDVFAGRKRGHFNMESLSRHPRIRVLTENVHPVGLIESAKAIYTVTSQMGFEGLLWGKEVRTFGMPFYAGWGLTRDELPAPARRKSVTLEQLVHASLVEYPRYVNPETGNCCDVEDVISYLSLQRRMMERYPHHVHAVGFPAYKRPALRRFLSGSKISFARRIEGLPERAALAVWGCDMHQGKASVAGGPETGSVGVLHLEDGFLRSVGLGAELVRPLSWVTDRRGIYYDATRPSDLENLLQTHEFDAGLIARAATLRQRIVAEGLTKYNVGKGRWNRPQSLTGLVGKAERKVILVPGQVESDASIRYGALSIRSNIELLRAVRNANPEAYIVYKPHPDVVSKLRAPGSGDSEAGKWCDEIVMNVSMHDLLGKVDEVHVLTSVAGFEALLRNKTVTTYGQPFYAGWGLTRDLAISPAVSQRRRRRLHLDQLVAGVLILYPSYVSRTTGRFTTPERALDELLIWREMNSVGIQWWRPLLRWVLSTCRSRR